MAVGRATPATPGLEPWMDGPMRRWLQTQLQDRSMLPAQRSPIRLVKAGAISDADFTHTPPDLTMGLDTTNLRLYVRVAGTWRYAGLT